MSDGDREIWNEMQRDAAPSEGEQIAELQTALTAAQAEIAQLLDKAIRFDLDRVGIESREREAIELVELRARVKVLEEALRFYATAGPVEFAMDLETKGDRIALGGRRARAALRGEGA